MAQRKEGATLGPYRIIEQVGMGGMATVYKAFQPSMERYIALKVLPAHYARDPKFVQRFVHEARTIAKLEHRNILPVHDFGEENGVTYLAMRYLDSGTLKDVLALGRLTYGDAARILEQTCAALGYAHQQGVVHRDVKPANVLIDNDGGVYLTDFGIAKVLESNLQLTETGAAIGTPAYMAPEQSLGRKVDGRTDIYALGIILYEMLLGRLPYQADTPMAVALAHIHEPLPLPREINPSIPEPIEAVILRALAKEPDDRYQQASQLAEAFNHAIAEANIDRADSVLAGLAVEARKVRAGHSIPLKDIPPDTLPPVVQPSPPAARKSMPVWMGAALAGALVLIVALAATGMLRPRGDEGTQTAARTPAVAATETVAAEEVAPLPEATPTEVPAAQEPTDAPTPTEIPPADTPTPEDLPTPTEMPPADTPTPEKAPTPTEVPRVLFQDDFEDGDLSGWFPLYDGSDALIDVIDDGTGNHVMRMTAGEWYATMAYGSPEWENYAVEVRGFLAESTPGEAEANPMLMLEFRVDLTRKRCQIYGFIIQTGGTNLAKLGNGDTCSFQSLGWNALHPLLEKRWYSLRVEAYRSTLRVYVDGELALETTDTELERGYIGFNVRPGDTVYYDDVRVFELISAPTSQ